MGFSKSKGSSGSSQTTATPFFFPGQEAYIPEFIAPFKQILGGNITSPMAQMMYQLASGAAGKEATAERGRLARTEGLTAPARQKMVGDVGTKAIQAAAGVPETLWETAAYLLGQYALQPPAVGQSGTSRESGGGGSSFKVCWVWTFFNGYNGPDTEIVRQYRDTKYGKGSYVDIGYDVMGRVVRPLMTNPIIRFLAYNLIYKPITSLAKGSRNPGVRMIAKFWETAWKVIGWGASQRLTRMVEEGR